MKRISRDDFFNGLFASLTKKGIRNISLHHDNFDEAVFVAYNSLEEKAAKEEMFVDFWILSPSENGASETVEAGLRTAAHYNMISLDNPTFQNITLKIKKDEADQLLEKLPGGERLYSELAEEMMKSYDGDPIAPS